MFYSNEQAQIHEFYGLNYLVKVKQCVESDYVMNLNERDPEFKQFNEEFVKC